VVAAVNRPRLAASATLFDRLDEDMLRATETEDGQTEADQFCEHLSALGGLRPAYCDWRDRNRHARKASSCGCGKSAPADQAGRLARAERAERELAELLVRLLLPSVVAGHTPKPKQLGYWPAGWVPPHTW
jgi:hypothetical protein